MTRGKPITATVEDDPLTPEDETGAYWITGLLEGEYIVREFVPFDMEQTYPQEGFHVVQLGPGERREGIDFGNWAAPPQTGGDSDNDGDVDHVDLDAWLDGYGQSLTSPSQGNFDGNSVTSGQDYLVWQSGYGNAPASPLPGAGTSATGLVAVWDFEQILDDTASPVCRKTWGWSMICSPQ